MSKLRGRLREAAEKELDALVKQTKASIEKQAKAAGVAPEALLHLCASKRTKSQRGAVLVGMIDKKEAELEALYNRQEKVEIGNDD